MINPKQVFLQELQEDMDFLFFKSKAIIKEYNNNPYYEHPDRETVGTYGVIVVGRNNYTLKEFNNYFI